MKTKFNGILTLLLAFVVQLSFAQEKTISGTVVDETNMPLPGATVVIKGTTTGTSTDFDGNYSISANSGDVLTFSYVGYADQDATVGTANSINISLAPDAEALEAVVVTAMGIKRKEESISSSYDVVDPEELTQANNPDVIKSLAGKVSGLQINNTSNGVNSSSRIVLRGSRSISSDGQALVVIDNAISTSDFLRTLPPESIATVTVLKGAQGAALYGSDGVNGAIIVTTKGSSGSKERITVEVSSSLDFQEVFNLPERQTTYGQGWQQDNGFDFGDGNGASYLIPWENGGWGPAFNDPRYAGQSWPTGLPQADGSFIMAPWEANNDNIKDFFKTGTVFQNNIAVTLGAQDSYVKLNVGKLNSNFVVEGDKMDRTTVGIKAGKTVGKLSVNAQVNYVTEKVNESAPGLYEDLLQTATNIPVDQFSGGLNEHHWTAYYKSPYWKRDNIRNDSRRDYFSAQFDATFRFNDHISASIRPNVRVRAGESQSYGNAWDQLGYDYTDAFTNAGYSYYGSNSETYGSLSGASAINSYFYGSQNSLRNIYNDLLINFDYDLTEDLTFSGLIGNNIRDNKYRRTQQGGQNLEIPGWYHINNVLNPDGAASLDNRSTRNRSYAFFANADFNYKDYLFLNLTSRYEKTSVIDDGFFYPSAGISFVPTKAFSSLAGNKVLSNAKVYFNAVQVGNVGPVDTYDTFQSPEVAEGFPFGDIAGFEIDQRPTEAAVKPEFVTSYEGGVNLEFFKRRITLDATYYTQETTDLITASTASTASGLRSSQSNVGNLTNKGFEVDLGLTPLKTDNFEWNVGVNYAAQKSVINSLTQDVKSVNLLGNGWIGIFAEEGEEFPLIKGTVYERDPNGNIIVDANGTPLRSSDFKKLGKATPDYILGFNTAVTYKGLRLSAIADYRTGHQFYSGSKREMLWSGHTQESAEFDRDLGYVIPGSVQETSPGVFTPNTQAVEGGGYSGVIDYYSNIASQTGEGLVLDATAFKIREVALSYSLPEKAIKSIGLNSLIFGVSARNLYSSFAAENQNFSDPESSNNSGSAQGISSVGRYPSTRTYGFNVKLTF